MKQELKNQTGILEIEGDSIAIDAENE